MSDKSWESSKVTQATFSWVSKAGRKPTLYTSNQTALDHMHDMRKLRHSHVWIMRPNHEEEPTSFGGQFGEEQLTTIRSFSMFSRDQLPTSDSKEHRHTWNTKYSIKWSRYEESRGDSLEVRLVTLPEFISTINRSCRQCNKNNKNNFSILSINCNKWWESASSTLRLRWGEEIIIRWLSADQHWGDNWEV